MAQRNAVTFRATPEILKALDDYCAKDFCKRGEAVNMLLEKAIASAGPDAAPSPMATMKAREQELKIRALEREDARRAKLLIWTEDAVQVVSETFQVMRQEGLTFCADLAREHGLDVRELENKFLNRMAGNFDDNQIDYGELANQCANGPSEPKT